MNDRTARDVDAEQVDALEPEQRAAALDKPIPRRKLTTAVIVVLWALRIYVLIAVPLVIYAFVRALAQH